MEMAWNSQSELFEQSYQGLMYGLEEAAAHGITTIGDGVVRKSLDAIESVRKQGSKKPYTLTHVELIDD